MAKLASDSQLLNVLLQARDAVVDESAQQSGYQTLIETDVTRLTRYLLMTGNRSDVAYLQENTNEYKAKIRGALEPAETLRDFALRAQIAEMETEPYDHDADIGLIVDQEIQRGFVEDALSKAKGMRVQILQFRSIGAVALAAYTAGKLEISEQAVAAAIACAKSNEPGAGSFFDHQQFLLELANMWFEGGYASAALKARQAAKDLLDGREDTYQGYWRDLGAMAAKQFDFAMAAETLKHISESEGQTWVVNRIKEAQTTVLSPDKALQLADTLSSDGFKFHVLRAIAQRQIEAGDTTGAAKTLELARKASSDEDSQFSVFRKADIAWEQIRMRDEASAEITIADALKDNETHRWGSDQVNGWMMLAECLAFMGKYDRALAVAWKNKDADSRASALQLIAYRETRAGHADWAIEWAETVKDAPGRARAFIGIAAGLIEHITGKEEDIIQN